MIETIQFVFNNFPNFSPQAKKNFYYDLWREKDPNSEVAKKVKIPYDYDLLHTIEHVHAQNGIWLFFEDVIDILKI